MAREDHADRDQPGPGGLPPLTDEEYQVVRQGLAEIPRILRDAGVTLDDLAPDDRRTIVEVATTLQAALDGYETARVDELRAALERGFPAGPGRL